jgi:hypothetical protein
VVKFDLFVGSEHASSSDVFTANRLGDDGTFRDVLVVSNHWTGTTGIQERLKDKLAFT